MVFFVVFSDSWCATVPESWVNEGEKGVFWPHKKINATAACKKCYVPKRDWEHFTYNKLLGPYDTYETARAVEMAAIDMSCLHVIDMSTCDEKSVQDVINEKLSTRQRKKPSRFLKSPNSYSHSDNDENNDNEDDEGFGADDALKKIDLPTFNYHGNNSGEKSPELLVETQELDYGMFLEDHPTFKKQTVTEIPGFDAKKEKDVNKDCQIVQNVKSSCLNKNETLNDPESTSTASTTAGSMESTQNSNAINKSDAKAGSLSMKNDIGNTKALTQSSVSNLTETVDGLTEKQSSTCHNCCPACRSTLNSLSRKLDVLLNLHAENSQPQTTKQSHLLPDFPISTHEELTTFNKQLTDNKVARDQ
ncbi:uncharacterized protein LOC123265417 isoform X2 [Cotesia glomerata]|uniref:uncharacterized protein LOC123265417 isoform X2 n=1 Tax=Cotesia glomerata TaxID=32391 RepID=UPI001D01AF83|nr:uncharacterized protein LOC123265417 isoform X2 [Cotesia glomerata]